MRLYINGDMNTHILFDYRYLAEKMWFKERNGQTIDFSYAGHVQIFKNDPTINLKLNKWIHDNRWGYLELKKNMDTEPSHDDEYISLEFEKAIESDGREKGECLRILTDHAEILTVDKRAAYIMAIEIARAVVGGHISEDDKKTWLTVEEFEQKHKDILSLSFDEANEISLEEIKNMDDIEDPLWEEEEERRQAYIAIHGEAPLEDDEEEPEDSEETSNYPETKSDNWFG